MLINTLTQHISYTKDTMERWFLIYCKSKQDTRARENLLRQGFDVYQPTINVVKEKFGCRPRIQCEALFPRYLFIKVDPAVKSIAPVLSTYGVVNFVKFGDRYATADDSLVAEIKNRTDKIISENNPLEYYKEGDDIFVNGQGFDNVKAIFCSLNGEKRATILMGLLGRESALTVPVEFLSRAMV